MPWISKKPRLPLAENCPTLSALAWEDPMKWLAVVVCLVFLAVIPAHADSFVGPEYNVVGPVIFTGNNVCGVCVETVNFSFTFRWLNTTGIFGSGIYGSYIPGSFSATQFGTMGSAPITSFNDGDIYCCGPGTYIPIDAFNGELDLDVSLFGTAPDPGAPTVFGAYLYGCNEECFREFGPGNGASEPYGVTFAATAAPEPATAGLLALSTLLVMGARSFWRTKRLPGHTAS